MLIQYIQEKIDTARNYYQQLLFRYTKETNPDDQSSRLNATLHRALKTVKDYAENIRSFPVLNNNATININNWNKSHKLKYKYLVSLLTESREQKSLKHPESFIKKALDNKTTVSCSTVRVSVRRRVSSVSWGSVLWQVY